MILPLSEEKLYLFELSEDGKKMKENGIVPILKECNNLEDGIVYVRFKFQDNEYFDLARFEEASFEKWKDILFKLLSKLGATKIKTTLLKEQQYTENSNNINNFNLTSNAEKNGNEGSVSVIYNTKESQNNSKEILYILEDEKESDGKKSSFEEVEKWLLDEKINLKSHPLLLELYEDFKDGRSIKRKSNIEIKSIISGYNNIDKALEIIANVTTPFLKVGLSTQIKSKEENDFRKYENKKLEIEIIC